MTKKTKIFHNYRIDKKELKKIMTCAFNDFGTLKASYLANQLKDIGFNYSTKAGLSIGIEDLKVPPSKRNLIRFANKKVQEAQIKVKRGEITEVERFQKVIKTWNTTSETLKDQVINYFRETDPLNSIYMMAFSGARGNISQVRQLVGMRGLMADPNGQIINLPILTNFREGLNITDYIISSYGARKGLVDTALRTADSGYLTRRLIDVAQDIITREKNCNTKHGILLTASIQGSNKLISLEERIIGRVLAVSVKNLKTGKLIAEKNQEITPVLAKKFNRLKINKVTVKSPLTCSSSRSICQQCYGWNLAYGNLIDLGEAVGIIAAQSIGEPGTQLTMRTFHTGGVFTVESSRQIKAKFSGKIIFSKTLKTQIIRTQYGEIAYVSENKGSLNLITYDNLIVKLQILPKTLIFIKNNSFVRKNEILFELTAKTLKIGGEKDFKYIYANESGVIYFDNRNSKKRTLKQKLNFKKRSNCLVWVFFGQVYTIPLNSKLQIQSNSNVSKNTILAESKLFTINDGKITILSGEELKVTKKSSVLQYSNIYIENNPLGIQECVIYGSMNRRIALKTINSSNQTKTFKLGELINLNYRSKTGGTFYSLDFSNKRQHGSIKKNKNKIVGGTIFYSPESTYEINQSIKQSRLYVKNGDYVKTNTKIFKNTITNISGVVFISKNKRSVKEIKIKPGNCYILNKNKHSALKLFNDQIVYPGETLFESIKIKQLSFTELISVDNHIMLGIFPIVRYEVTNIYNEFKFFSSISKKNLYDIKACNFKTKFKHAQNFKTSFPIQFIKYSILNEPSTISNNYLVNYEITQNFKKSNKLKLNLFYEEKLNFKNLLPNELKKQKIDLHILTQTDQFVEPYTNLNSYQKLIANKLKILNIKQQILNKEKKILLITNSDYQTIYLEQSNTNYTKNKVIKLDTKEINNFVFKNSGFLKKKHGNSFTLKKGSPYLFSQGARIEKQSGDIIHQGEKLGQLIYEQVRTEDIVQGLPRVEEILEARKPKFEANLAIRPGIVFNIRYNRSDIHIWIMPNNSLKLQKDFYKLNYSHRLLIGLFEFINVGQPLNDAPINAHTILDIYFSYFKSLKLFNSYNSAYRSFRKIQAIFLNSVQAVYYSQGVSISDKHIEIIIKQMTGKVQIISSGNSPLLPDEFVDLKRVYYINNCLTKKVDAIFKPIILGITKASLKTNSFISAASFQHTTKILTEAAIQGKSDWLRGLKENVIVGRLIPAGTGFNRYSDISYMQVKVPSLLINEKENLSSTPQNSKIKYKNLKEKFKFKFK